MVLRNFELTIDRLVANVSRLAGSAAPQGWLESGLACITLMETLQVRHIPPFLLLHDPVPDP